MSTDAAFLAAIREQPLDDLRRLVYADWLDEQGRHAEAEYLRLVAALAEPGTPVDVTHPHAVRLLGVAEEIDFRWRVKAASRFALSFDSLDTAQKINFIKVVREVSGFGLGDAKTFSESLPKPISTVLTFEGAARRSARFEGVRVCRSISPTTRDIAEDQPQRDIVLRWFPASFDAESQSALAHLRQILASDPETVALAAEVPDTVEVAGRPWNVILTHSRPLGEVLWWQELLMNGGTISGHTAEPPFTGLIEVFAYWQ